jgi:hypothetical protein
MGTMFHDLNKSQATIHDDRLHVSTQHEGRDSQAHQYTTLVSK